MPDEASRFVADDQELLHHSTLRVQRAAEVRQAATAHHDHLDRLHKELGVAGHVGVQALKEYHLEHRPAAFHYIADTHDAMSALLLDHVVSSNGADVDGGNAVGAADEADR